MQCTVDRLSLNLVDRIASNRRQFSRAYSAHNSSPGGVPNRRGQTYPLNIGRILSDEINELVKSSSLRFFVPFCGHHFPGSVSSVYSVVLSLCSVRILLSKSSFSANRAIRVHPWFELLVLFCASSWQFPFSLFFPVPDSDLFRISDFGFRIFPPRFTLHVSRLLPRPGHPSSPQFSSGSCFSWF